MRIMFHCMAAGIFILGAWPRAARSQDLLTAPPAVQEQNGLTNGRTRLSYALGYIFGAGLRHEKFDVDLALLARAIKDGMADEMAVTNMGGAQAPARDVLKAYREEMAAKAKQERLELARRNRELGKAFCETNAYREGVTTLPSGLQFRVLKQGEGPLVDTNLVIETVWRGTLIDGTEFQDTRKQTLGSLFRFWNQYVIPGLAEALPMMRVGDRWEIVMPADLAYRDVGSLEGVRPGDTLIYDLEVLSLEQRSGDLVVGSSSEIPAANSGAAPQQSN